MAGKRFPKGSEEFVMFMDYWALCQKFWEPEDKDEYWEGVIEETDAFCKKYGNTTFPRGLAMALINYLEKELRNRKTNTY